jgi:hypothetical protein
MYKRETGKCLPFLLLLCSVEQLGTFSFHPGTPLFCRRPAAMYMRDIEISLPSFLSSLRFFFFFFFFLQLHLLAAATSAQLLHVLSSFSSSLFSSDEL